MSAAVTLAGGCSTERPTSKSTGPDLTACAAEPDKPLVYLDPKTDQPTGFAFDIVRTIVEGEAGRLRLKPVPAPDLVFALLDRDCDVIVSKFPITDEARQSVAFTGSYLDDDLALAVRAPEADATPTVASMAGRSIGVAPGSSGAVWLGANPPGGVTVKQYPGAGDLFAALRKRDIDGAVVDRAVAAHRSTLDDSIRITEVIPTGRELGFAVRPDDPSTLRLLDRGLERLRSDGRYDAIRAHWLGDAPPL